jgi:antitoxin (DNA-binding transcriptional repressor) of toxin-antitoxin stability system
LVTLVDYEDVPAMCDQILDEVETAGVTFQVLKGGRPMVRIEPVDEAIRPQLAAEHQR